MIGRIITRGRNSGLKCLSTALSPSSLTFPRYFSPKTESLFTGYVLGSRCVLKTPTLTNSVEKIHLKFNKSIFRAPGLKGSSDWKYSHLCLISAIFVFLRFVFPACWFNHKKAYWVVCCKTWCDAVRVRLIVTRKTHKKSCSIIQEVCSCANVLHNEYIKLHPSLNTKLLQNSSHLQNSPLSLLGKECHPIQVPLHPGVSRDPHCILKFLQ